MSDYIYIITNELGYIKVGVSKHPEKRVKQLQTGNEHTLSLLFTEEFILQPITSNNVIFTDNKLTIYGNFVTLNVSKHQDKTYISIMIRNVMLLEYVILN